MTIVELKAAACSTAESAQLFLPYIDETFTRFAIGTPVRQLCFLAQISHESGNLFYTEELASGAAYEGRSSLGNTHPGDGVKFKGRGLIQITGRANYQALSEALHEDFINNPTLLGGKNVKACSAVQLRNAALSAGWFWNRTGLNSLADKINLHQPVDEGTNLDFFKAITKRINGGYNGLEDRLHRFKQGLAALTTTSPTVKAVAA